MTAAEIRAWADAIQRYLNRGHTYADVQNAIDTVNARHDAEEAAR